MNIENEFDISQNNIDKSYQIDTGNNNNNNLPNQNNNIKRDSENWLNKINTGDNHKDLLNKTDAGNQNIVNWLVNNIEIIKFQLV